VINSWPSLTPIVDPLWLTLSTLTNSLSLANDGFSKLARLPKFAAEENSPDANASVETKRRAAAECGSGSDRLQKLRTSPKTGGELFIASLH
jgi:hypothetical protein